MDDETLIARYYGCDDNALGELYERYFPRLVAFLRRSVSVEQAEDLAEEAFFRLVRTKATVAGRFNPIHNTSFRSWLFRIAANGLRDHLRQVGRQPTITAEAEDIEAPAIEEPWEDPATVQVDAAGLFAGPVGECLAELTNALREVLLLSLVGQTLTEISAGIGISYNAAGNRLHQARRRMEACLREKGIRFVSRHSDLPPGTEVVMTFPDQVWVRLNPVRFAAAGYRLVVRLEDLEVGDRVVLVFREEGATEILVQQAGAARQENNQ